MHEFATQDRVYIKTCMHNKREFPSGMFLSKHVQQARGRNTKCRFTLNHARQVALNTAKCGFTLKHARQVPLNNVKSNSVDINNTSNRRKPISKQTL